MAIGLAKAGDDAIALLGKAGQFGSALYRDAELLQPLDQQALMLVLRKNVQERIGGQILADGLEGEPRLRFALHPHIDRRNLVAMLDHEVGEVRAAGKVRGCALEPRARARSCRAQPSCRRYAPRRRAW